MKPLSIRADSTFNSKWSQDHLDNKKCIYILWKERKKERSKSTYFDHPNKNAKHPNLKIIKN